MSFDFKNDPFENFLELFKEAQIKGVPEHNAMALATVNERHQPSVRIVLFKGLVRRGFSFYTNYNGRKGRDIEVNNAVAATFYWPHLDQQIRIEGIAEKLTDEESEKYFASRPRLSQIGAWTSEQSDKIESFEFFQKKAQQVEAKFQGQVVPRPPHWGGYRIIPTEFEFWFARSGRMHERYVFQGSDLNWNRFLRSP
ncbi:MAG: pyridoxamine 5'-phosphate oxidase [Bdellovibrionales bacterium RIFCSPHIGHO2_01_FULL_40_29]|nr:MAG: pyridoxamine 5'-phosphate oxidase [Bdellovibrionales bacterium RIFCSPHIGHO2_01_FULL_40_29]OFZ32720.1 MAG: pyridoxamine 5'-phosphate oxidase [Bdellovibrionales bacterium RIFCSPHIGHO2_02_FULL_40_15]